MDESRAEELRRLARRVPGRDGERDALRAGAARRVVGEGCARMMARFDVLPTPTTPLPACRVEADETAPRMRNTAPFNLTRLPALSLPCGFTAEGMPIGLQIVGLAWAEATILRVGNAFEHATGWHIRRPGVPRRGPEAASPSRAPA